MLLGDVVDQLHDQHSLSDTGTTKQSDLASLGVWGKKIDDLNTSDQKFGSGTLFGEGWGFSVNGSELLSSNWSSFINGFSNNVDNSAESFWADRYFNRIASVCDFLSTHKTLSGIQSNGSNVASSQVLGNFKDETMVCSLNLKCVKNWRKGTIKLDINNGSDNLRNFSNKLIVCAEQSYEIKRS
eukprot:scpid82748/ scgid4581/ 